MVIPSDLFHSFLSSLLSWERVVASVKAGFGLAFYGVDDLDVTKWWYFHRQGVVCWEIGRSNQTLLLGMVVEKGPGVLLFIVRVEGETLLLFD